MPGLCGCGLFLHAKTSIAQPGLRLRLTAVYRLPADTDGWLTRTPGYFRENSACFALDNVIAVR